MSDRLISFSIDWYLFAYKLKKLLHKFGYVFWRVVLIALGCLVIWGMTVNPELLLFVISLWILALIYLWVVVISNLKRHIDQFALVHEKEKKPKPIPTQNHHTMPFPSISTDTTVYKQCADCGTTDCKRTERGILSYCCVCCYSVTRRGKHTIEKCEHTRGMY